MSTSRYSTYGTVLAYASPEMPPTIDVIVQTHRIGDLAIAAMPFEVFAEIGLELKRRSPIQPLMNISLANGAHGYLPTPAQHKLGGYETWIGVNQRAARRLGEDGRRAGANARRTEGGEAVSLHPGCPEGGSNASSSFSFNILRLTRTFAFAVGLPFRLACSLPHADSPDSG